MSWRKSTRSGENGGDCVELADAAGAVADAVAVRDSKESDGPFCWSPALPRAMR
ncbi:DUF397 domain-containing protein [Actinomadura nitritigenes]|uniref:DUF397 domain-containing protein n=1 Tax=Actinomadura nitritigenes TaxID=134602 RepID=UPI003D8B709F